MDLPHHHTGHLARTTLAMQPRCGVDDSIKVTRCYLEVSPRQVWHPQLGIAPILSTVGRTHATVWLSQPVSPAGVGEAHDQPAIPRAGGASATKLKQAYAYIR